SAAARLASPSPKNDRHGAPNHQRRAPAEGRPPLRGESRRRVTPLAPFSGGRNCSLDAATRRKESYSELSVEPQALAVGVCRDDAPVRPVPFTCLCCLRASPR